MKVHVFQLLAYLAATASALVLHNVNSNELSHFDKRQSGPILDLGYAKYRGSSSILTGVNTWRGIQYAAPPVGNNRWRSPGSIEDYLIKNSTSVRDATVAGNWCVQGGVPWSPIPPSTTIADNESEDCLILDIVTPISPRAPQLPVVIYIHGGAYLTGNTMDTSFFASWASGNVVVVSIQYRLGWYGWLSGNEVKSNGTANAGLLDQRAAIDWVKKYASKFGGDPNKISIWVGGSAGSGSVLSHVIWKGGEQNPPFRAAAAEFPAMERFRSADEQDVQFQHLLESTKCPDLACLRSLPFDTLALATKNAFGTGYRKGLFGTGDTWLSPVIDGTYIKELPSDAFSSGRFSKVALLLDRDQYEGELFSNFTISNTQQVKTGLEKLFRFKDDAVFDELLALYPQSAYDSSFFQDPAISGLKLFGPIDGNQAWAQSAEIFGDYLIGCPAHHAAAGGTKAGVPTWKLWFNAGIKLHGAVQLFAFVPQGLAGNNNIEGAIKNWLLGFFVNLDPNKRVAGAAQIGGTIPNWPSYSSSASANNMYITESGFTVQADPDASAKCKFFFDNRDRFLN